MPVALVVVGLEVGDADLGVEQGEPLVHVQAFVADSVVERLDEPVAPRFAGALTVATAPGGDYRLIGTDHAQGAFGEYTYTSTFSLVAEESTTELVPPPPGCATPHVGSIYSDVFTLELVPATFLLVDAATDVGKSVLFADCISTVHSVNNMTVPSNQHFGDCADSLIAAAPVPSPPPITSTASDLLKIVQIASDGWSLRNADEVVQRVNERAADEEYWDFTNEERNFTLTDG